MKINDIINELVDSKTSISAPLLKTLVLANRLGNDELLNWVKQELDGYKSVENIPSYRICNCQIIGDYNNGNYKVTKYQIPLNNLKEDIQDKLQSINFFEGVASLESMITNSGGNTLEIPLDTDVVRYVQNHLQGHNPRLQLLNLSKRFSPNMIIEILSKIRHRLLNFMLKIEKEFGEETEFEDLKNEEKLIQYFMSQTIISGDGNVVNNGSDSKISATINISKGNKNYLEDELKKMGVSESDTAELLSVIDEQIPSTVQQPFNSKVNFWIQKMIAKSVDGTWQISIATAATFLAEVILKYYGLK